MKKTIGILCLVLLTGILCPLAIADEQSAALLDKLRREIRSYTSYRMSVTAAMEGEGTARGTITVSGRMFAAKLLGQELYYDGNTLWNYVPSDKEVVIERLSADDPNVLSNPSKLLNVDPDDYHHRMLSPVTSGKKTFRVVELKPKVRSSDYSEIQLFFEGDSALPARILIDTPASDQPVQILLDKIEPNIAVDKSTFQFDATKHRNLEVIDFR